MLSHHKMFRSDDDGWLDMPGPAVWWSCVDLEHEEWSAMAEHKGAERAFDLMVEDFGNRIPKDC